MKNNIKLFIGILIGIVLTSTVVYAVNLGANNISFEPTDENWNVSTVQGALNDLYNATKDVNDIVIMSSGSYTTTKAYTRAYVVITRLATPDFLRDGVSIQPVKTGTHSNYYMSVYKVENVAEGENWNFYGTTQLFFFD